MPDDHQFPATEPGADAPCGSGGSKTSDTSLSDSPSREHLRSLNQMQHADTSVPGFEARTTFVSHVTDQVLPEGGPPPSAQPGSSDRRPQAPAPPPGNKLSDDEIDDEAFAAELQAQQDAWDLEFNMAKNTLTQSEEQAAARVQRKKDREASRAALKQAPRGGTSGGRAHTDARVSFSQCPPSPRRESATPADRQFHPEYSNDGRQVTHSRSTGSNLDLDILTELFR